jgi:multicomponent Na+:H+ antiporter subunit D
VALAALALFGHRRLEQVPNALVRPAAAALTGLRQLHSGHIGDYIAWWTAAAGVLGSVSLLLLT